MCREAGLTGETLTSSQPTGVAQIFTVVWIGL
jgi:hypothetical protein